MTPDDAMAILAHMNDLRDKVRALLDDRAALAVELGVARETVAAAWMDICDLKAQIADVTAERDALAVELDEALCINDQQQEAAQLRRYGRPLP